MNFYEFYQSAATKKLISKLWHWAIAIAILGGVFFVNNWSYGNIILSIAGIMLVVIYFLAGFEPLHEQVDWTLVFPQLAGISEEEDSALTDPLTEVKKLRQEIEELKKELKKIKNQESIKD